MGRTTVLPLFPSRLAARQVGSVSFWGESGRQSTRANCGAVGSYDKQTEKERKAVDKRAARADSVCMNTTTTSQQIVSHYRLHMADEPMSWTEFATLSDAIDEVRAVYGSGIVTDIGEDRTLVWACEEDANDDDGANAVADIRFVSDDTVRA